jgi:glycosyltransferase involved in cell wall biosynthesis
MEQKDPAGVDAGFLPEVSIVVPCFNERAGLATLHSRLEEVGARLGVTYEILLVDDGSRDGTGDEIKRLSGADAHVRGVLLSRNFGHQAAVSAGCAYARGRAVIVMDADLQHPPELIPEFLAHWRAGYEVVYAYRRNAAPRFGYRLHNWLCDVRIPSESADFRLMDRVVVDALGRMPERNRFVRGMIAWLGFRQMGIPYDEPARQAGQPAYSFRKRVRLFIDSIFSFSVVPLRVSVCLGLVTLVLGLIYAVYVLTVLLVFGRAGIASGWPALIVTVLILGGVQLICLGMVAEYVGRIYEEVKQRPLYVVRELTAAAAGGPAGTPPVTAQDGQVGTL